MKLFKAIVDGFNKWNLARKLNKHIPSARPLTCGGNITPRKIDTDGNGNIIIYHSLHNIPTQFREYAYNINTEFKLFLDKGIPVKFDLNSSLETNLEIMLQSFTHHTEMLTEAIEKSLEYFNDNVSCEVSVSTPRGHHGTYYADKKHVHNGNGIIKFYDPYTNKEHTFTAPFHYSTVEAEFMNKTFYNEWHDSSDCYY